MALGLAYTLDVYGKKVVFGDAIWKITNISGDRNKMNMTVSVFSDQTEGNKLSEYQYSFIPDMNDGAVNIFKQGYLELKKQPSFADAVDI